MRDLRKPPRRFSDEAIALFRFARWFGSRVWPGKAAYRGWLARGALSLEQVDVPVAELPDELVGLRMVQVSDLHGGVFLDEATLDPVVDLVRACEPDVLLCTGDFVTRTMEDVHELGAFFARIDAPLGKFSVFGNHDYRERREGQMARVLFRQGVRVLRNASTLVRRGNSTLRLVGLEDLEEARMADLDAALARTSPDDAATVLLCHNPDVVDQLPSGRFDLVVSGHSHGGQINLPGYGSIGRRWMPRRVAGTFALDGGGLLHVNRGLGVLVVPLRWGAAPEVTCFTLGRARSASWGGAGR